MASKAYSEREAREKITQLYEDSNGIPYETLMKENLGLFKWSRHHFREEPEIFEMIRETQKKAVGVSLRRIARDEPIYARKIVRNHPKIEGAIRRLYQRQENKSVLQIACEEAEANYQLKRKPGNLRQLLEDVREIGNKPEDFTARTFDEPPYQNLGKALRRRFGKHGKSIMLIGIDYAKQSNPRIKRSKFVFSNDELKKIRDDNSLTGLEKGTCFFNALSFQHYEYSKQNDLNFSRIHLPNEEVLEGSNKTNILTEDFFEEYGVKTRFSLVNGANLHLRFSPDTFNCDLVLSRETNNPFHFTRFSISSNDELAQREFTSKARLPAMALYHQFHKTLSGFFFEEDDL